MPPILRFCQSRSISAIDLLDNCTARLAVAGVTGWKSLRLVRPFAKVSRVPRPTIVPFPIAPEHRAGHLARRICLGISDGPPTRYPARHAPAL